MMALRWSPLWFTHLQGQLGGKGTVRRKKKAVHKPTGGDDKRITATLKRLNVGPIPGIEEVNLYRDDGKVLHFENPKGEWCQHRRHRRRRQQNHRILSHSHRAAVQANLQSNIYVIAGTAEEKTASVGGVASQADQMRMLQEMAKRAGGMEALLSSLGKGGAGLGGLGGIAGMGDGGGGDDDEAPAAGLADFEAVSE